MRRSQVPGLPAARPTAWAGCPGARKLGAGPARAMRASGAASVSSPLGCGGPWVSRRHARGGRASQRGGRRMVACARRFCRHLPKKAAAGGLQQSAQHLTRKQRGLRPPGVQCVAGSGTRCSARYKMPAFERLSGAAPAGGICCWCIRWAAGAAQPCEGAARSPGLAHPGRARGAALEATCIRAAANCGACHPHNKTLMPCSARVRRC